MNILQWKCRVCGKETNPRDGDQKKLCRECYNKKMKEYYNDNFKTYWQSRKVINGEMKFYS
jgi:hypothetical protein